MSHWRAANDANVSGEGESGKQGLAIELAEDLAKKEYYAALRLMRDGRLEEAKQGFNQVLQSPIPETPFSAKLFRLSLKNLARACEKLGDLAGALDSTVRAAGYLSRDDADLALWMTMRRYAKRVNQKSFFYLADGVLQTNTEEGEYVPVSPPSSSLLSPATLLLANEEPQVLELDVDSLTWSALLTFVGQLEPGRQYIISRKMATIIDMHPESGPEPTNEPFSSLTLDESNDAVSVTDTNVTIDLSQNNATSDVASEPQAAAESQEHPSSDIEEDLTTPERKKRARAKNRERLFQLKPRETKRQQILMAKGQQNEDEDSESEDKPRHPSEYLPKANTNRLQDLVRIFLDRISTPNQSRSSGILISPARPMKQSPERSPVKPGYAFNASEEEQQKTCQKVGEDLLQMTFPCEASRVLEQVVKSMYENRDSVIPSAFSHIVDLVNRSYGFRVTRPQAWLALLCKVESVNDLTAPTQLSSASDVSISDETTLLEYALECNSEDDEEYGLACKTLSRFIERGRILKHFLLVDRALKKLESISRGNEFAGFIDRERHRLDRAANLGKLDDVLEECAVSRPAFAKNPMNCLKLVAQECASMSRPDIFARYRLDALNNALERKAETLVYSVLDYAAPFSEVLANDNEITETLWPLQEDAERTACQIFQLFPMFCTKQAIDSLKCNYQGSLWAHMNPTFWAWIAQRHKDAKASENNESTSNELENYIESLRAQTDTEIFHGISQEDLLCIIHCALELNCLGSSICAFGCLEKRGDSLETAIRNALDFCGFACEENPEEAVEHVFGFLLQDCTLRATLRSLNDAKLEKECEDLMCECALMFFFPEEKPQRFVDDEDAEIQWMAKNATRLWQFLAPHLWCSTKTGLSENDKRDLLEQRLLRVVSEGPVTEEIYRIHLGGFWLHLVEMEEEEEVLEADSERKVFSDEGRSIQTWLERDLQVEPQRISSLLKLGRRLFLEEQRKRLEDMKAARKQQGQQLSDSTVISHEERGPSRLGSIQSLRQRQSIDCLTEIDKVVTRQLPPSNVKPTYLASWNGRWVLVCSMNDTVADVITLDEQQHQYLELKERHAKYLREQRIGQRMGAGASLSQDSNDVATQDSNGRIPPSKRSKHDEGTLHRSVSNSSSRKSQRIVRHVALGELTPLSMEEFVIEGLELRDTWRYFIGDVLPCDVPTTLLDALEYIILQDRPEVVDQCIDICEWTSDKRVWSFYWFKGLVTDDRTLAMEYFNKARSLTSSLAKSLLDQNTKVSRNASSLIRLTETEAIARYWKCRLALAEEENMDGPELSNLKNECEKELKATLKYDKNLLVARLLCKVSSDESQLGKLFDPQQKYIERWEVNNVLFDRTRERDWGDEWAETFVARLEELKQAQASGEDPDKTLKEAISLLQQYSARQIAKPSTKLSDVVPLEVRQDLVEFISKACVPSATLKLVCEIQTSFSTKESQQIVNACDQRIMQLGGEEFGKDKSFAEIWTECRNRFPEVFQKKQKLGKGRALGSRVSGATTTKQPETEGKEDAEGKEEIDLIREDSRGEMESKMESDAHSLA